MKLFIFSDIHGIVDNLENLKTCIMKEVPNKLIVLGDLYYAGPTYRGNAKISSFEVHEFLQSQKDNLIAVKGNCDSLVDIKASDFPISEGLLKICIDGFELTFTHGNEFSMKRANKISDGTILIYGHEHTPYIEKQNNSIFCCVGSVSLPKDENPPTYAIYEGGQLQIKSLLDGNVLHKLVLKEE